MCNFTLLNQLFFNRENGDERAVLATLLELDSTIAKSEEGMILTHSNVLARVVDSAALTDNDITSDTLLTTKNLNA